MKPIYYFIVPSMSLLTFMLFCVSFMEFRTTGPESGLKALGIALVFGSATFGFYKKGRKISLGPIRAASQDCLPAEAPEAWPPLPPD